MSEMITDVPGAEERRIADDEEAAAKKAEARTEAAATARRLGESASRAGIDDSIIESQERLAKQLEDPDFEPEPMRTYTKVPKIGGPEA